MKRVRGRLLPGRFTTVTRSYFCLLRCVEVDEVKAKIVHKSTIKILYMFHKGVEHLKCRNFRDLKTLYIQITELWSSNPNLQILVRQVLFTVTRICISIAFIVMVTSKKGRNIIFYGFINVSCKKSNYNTIASRNYVEMVLHVAKSTLVAHKPQR